MRVVSLNDLSDDVRASMHGARWLILQADEIQTSTSLLMFTELDDILVAVDHRGSVPQPGLWQRAVHLILIDASTTEAQEFQRTSGITKVIGDADEDIRAYLW
ncbi:MAG: hypothetical protein L7U62_07260 [Candidatus Poseidoniaceae archaeon]|nr:hypothetical protein [Candidatus Poseidoniaceae archaeon]